MILSDLERELEIDFNTLDDAKKVAVLRFYSNAFVKLMNVVSDFTHSADGPSIEARTLYAAKVQEIVGGVGPSLRFIVEAAPAGTAKQ